MNTRRFLALSALLAASLALPFGGTAKSSEPSAMQTVAGTASSQLILKIEGLKSHEGQILVGLYDTENGFESERELIGRSAPVSGETTEIVFEDIPSGEYALKIFHDEDGDGQLDTNVLGIPSEPYAFSNNASDPFSAPEWEETVFTVQRGRVTHSVDLD